jgi:protein-tyrosine sulfotransferase
LFIIIITFKIIVEVKKFLVIKNNKISPIIFIGGSPRSGTTLMRSILDAHPKVSCGEETRIIPKFIDFSKNNFKNDPEQKRMEEAGITSEIVDAASSAYIYEIIKRHSFNSPVLCTKDPTDLMHTEYLSRLFPEAKFILMVRDARATVFSVGSRAINSAGYSKKSVRDYRGNLENWNNLYKNMYNQCLNVGPDRCLLVHYEQLVLKPEKEIRNIMNFLKIEWNDAVLSHEKYIGSKIKLSKTEKSSDQVIKPINLFGLSAWFGKIPNEILDKIDEIAPMLSLLGYDTKSKTPNYGEPDEKVQNNSLNILKNQDYWAAKAKNYSSLKL